MTEFVRFGRVELRAATEGFLVGMAVPFDEVTHNVEHRNGERFVGGAFTFDEVAVTAGARYPVLVDHDDGLRVGSVVHLQETRQGLLAGLRFDGSAMGRQVFGIASHGPVGLSVAFHAIQTARGAQGERVVVSARLDHLGIVAVPAYETARTFVPSSEPLALRSTCGGGSVRWHVPPHLTGLGH